MDAYFQKFTNGLAFGLWAAVMVIAVSLAYAATTYYSDLPTASSGATMRSADWNALVNYANRAVKQDTEIITVTGSNVGIGTASPGAKLELNGQIKITGGVPGAGKVLTSDASGVASWKSGMNQTTITASIPANQILTNTCNATSASLSVTTPGFYGIELHADSYLYSGNFNTLTVSFSDGTNSYCYGQASITYGSTSGYMRPNAFCIEHLAAGTYYVNVSGSNANTCPTSSMDKIYSGSVKIRLLSAD